MRTVTITTDVYKFQELPEDVRAKIIRLEIDYFSSLADGKRPEWVDQASEKCEKMETPWFFYRYALDYGEDTIMYGLNSREFDIMGNEFYE